MPRRIVIIQGHPDGTRQHLCDGLADAYEISAMAAGHSVSRFDLGEIEFPLLHSEEEFETGAVPESLQAAVEAIAVADHILLIFPLWLGTMPALVKAFLEQVLKPGKAFAYRRSGFPKKLMKGKTARMVVTMGMPGLAYRWWFGAHGLIGIERNILNFVGIYPVYTTLFGMASTAGEWRRRRWIRLMKKYGRRGR
ncbi:MAG TPA: NAD(P)H-dependent oxidoreductase [Alphaproteobacteria bacterium]|nr:NAD(P)H-dependent oxidoreductase [Alphaproteobacteria bacterium]